jgi:hypothetical protein
MEKVLLNPNKFQWENSFIHNGISNAIFHSYDIDALPDWRDRLDNSWKYVGECYGGDVPIRPNTKSIAVMLEDVDGFRYWCHVLDYEMM